MGNSLPVTELPPQCLPQRYRTAPPGSGPREPSLPRSQRPHLSLHPQRRPNRPQSGHADGSATFWVGETEPIYRVRWLLGMTVYPGRSYIRCDYILVNPTDRRQAYQFWATAATHAHEFAQAQNPRKALRRRCACHSHCHFHRPGGPRKEQDDPLGTVGQAFRRRRGAIQRLQNKVIVVC
ncbi:MAG: DUF5107 domain-containing protein [Acidobacteria bacterium]|nr:DUF5107 domain-containing protein [Acidobacteriota bacterium]